MTRLPAPSGSPAARRSGGLLAHQGEKAVSYVPASRVGFEHVPAEILETLVARGILVGTEVAATATPSITKRRADGSHYQLVTAWWSCTQRFLVLEARRELVPTGDGRFRSAGGWSGTGTSYRLPDGVKVEESTWTRPSGTGDPARAKREHTDDPLEILPPQVTKPVLGGDADAWQEFGERWASETVVASRLLADRVRVLRATRHATLRRALEGAVWKVETIDAPFVGTADFSIGVSGRVDLVKS